MVLDRRKAEGKVAVDKVAEDKEAEGEWVDREPAGRAETASVRNAARKSRTNVECRAISRRVPSALRR